MTAAAMGRCVPLGAVMLLLMLLTLIQLSASQDYYTYDYDYFNLSDIQQQQKNNASQNLNQILCNSTYNNKQRPEYEGSGGPVPVRVGIYVKGFGSIEESSMDYRMTIFLWQRWLDPRLNYSSGVGNVTDMAGSSADCLWKPTLFFDNEKSAIVHQVTTPNSMLRIRKDGDVLYSMRLTLTLSCPMDLHTFPMDTQFCPVIISSAAYTLSDVKLQWEEGVKLAENLSIPQFLLNPYIHLENITHSYITGNFSTLRATFRLERQTSYYVSLVYVPSALLVVLSWVSFWIPIEAAPARVGLGITTVLTVTTQSTGSRANMPKVSYTNAMDVWMATCLVFVFAALLEYAMVQTVSRHWQRAAANREGRRRAGPSLGGAGGGGGGGKVEMSMRRRWAKSRADGGDTASKSGGETHAAAAAASDANDDEESLGELQRQYMAKAVSMDLVARVIFPVAFLVFNTTYWAIYVSKARFV